MFEPRRCEKLSFYSRRFFAFARFWSKRNFIFNFGRIGLRARSWGKLEIKHFENVRVNIIRKVKNFGFFKLWFRQFPFFFVTAKPIEVRMGKGKGNFCAWLVPVSRGLIFLEIVENNLKLCFSALKFVQRVLTFGTELLIDFFTFQNDCF